jgi:hypothetical protein
MAKVKISELPSLSPATLDTTYVVGISGSTTYKISINQLTSSLDTTFATDLVTAALSSSLNSKLSTSSYSTDSASFNSRIISGSVVAGTISSSAQITAFGFLSTSTDLSSLNTISASYLSFTQSYYSASASFDSRVDSLENATSSYLTSLNGAISGAGQISDLGFVTGSYTTINSFNSLTQSFNSISQSFSVISGSVGTIDFSTLATTGSNTFIGNQTISGGLSINNSGYSWSFESNGRTKIPNITFNSDRGTGMVGIKPAPGREFQIETSTAESSVGPWSFGLDGTLSAPVGANIIRVGNLVTTSSFNTFTHSIDSRVDSLENATSSYLTSLNGAISSSAQVLNGSDIFSSSAQLPIGLVSSSTQLPSNLISGSSQISTLGFITGSYISSSTYTTDSSSFNSRIISGSAVAGTISSSAQISALGYITSSQNVDTSSFVQSSQTSSMSVKYATTASYAENIQISGSITNVKSITFDRTAGVSVVEGQMAWNNSDGTLDIGLNFGDVVLQVGQEQHFVVRNATGTTISNGTAVYASGLSVGSKRIEVSPFTANGTTDEVRFLGLATHNISDGVNGVVTNFGYVRGLDTRGTSATAISVGDETWAEGDILYAHPTAAGKLTKVAPKDKITVAMVTTRHQTTGVLFVRPSSFGHIDDLHDVQINTGSLVTGSMLEWNGDYFVNNNTFSSSVDSRLDTLEASIITGSPNYVQTLGARVTGVTTTGVTIISGSITTTGNPVQIMVTGDANPVNVTSWTRLQIYRNETAIGNIVQVENSSNLNVPYCLNVIDTPSAGTYTYSMRTVSGISGLFDFGESTGPTLTAVELKTNTNLPSTNNSFTGTNVFSGSTTLRGAVAIGTSSGDEGGEINLAIASTNQTLTGSVNIDVYRNTLRLWEGGGTNRGVYIDLSKAPAGNTGELMWKASGLVNAGTFVTLDNIKATIPTIGSRGLALATVSGTISGYISGHYQGISGGSAGVTQTISLSTSTSTSMFNWSFGQQGDTAHYILRDDTNNRIYRFIMMIGGGYNNNFISIERLH